MNMKALIPIADGSEEIESVTVIDILRRAGVDVTVAVIGSKGDNCLLYTSDAADE